jgi:hypothetical protein
MSRGYRRLLGQGQHLGYRMLRDHRRRLGYRMLRDHRRRCRRWSLNRLRRRCNKQMGGRIAGIDNAGAMEGRFDDFWRGGSQGFERRGLGFYVGGGGHRD